MEAFVALAESARLPGPTLGPPNSSRQGSGRSRRMALLSTALRLFKCVPCVRRAAALCAAPAGMQPCATTLLAWQLGSHSDPAVTMPLDWVKMWMQLWARASQSQRRSLRVAWARALPRILLGGVRWWARVTGPLQATIAILGQIGWHAVEAARWISKDGNEYAELLWATGIW